MDKRSRVSLYVLISGLAFWLRFYQTNPHPAYVFLLIAGMAGGYFITHDSEAPRG